MSDELRKRLREYDVDFELTDGAKAFLAKEGYDPAFGARPLRRAIQKHIEDRLSEELLKGNIKKGDSLKIDQVDGELVVTTVDASAAALEKEAEADNK
ncbi:Negative regulator of genetic competence ClpC/MecB [compost metagenome]